MLSPLNLRQRSDRSYLMSPCSSMFKSTCTCSSLNPRPAVYLKLLGTICTGCDPGICRCVTLYNGHCTPSAVQLKSWPYSKCTQMTALDSTVVDPLQKAQIQQYLGISLEQADKGAVAFIVDRSRHAGNQAFKEKRYAGTCCTADSSRVLFHTAKLKLFCHRGLQAIQSGLGCS